MTDQPSVTVAIPVLNEEARLQACLDAVLRQTYPRVVEVLVVDGGSTDGTRRIAEGTPNVTLLHNPAKLQAAALNIALDRAKGDIFVRVDGRTVIADDYVERCIDALAASSAAMVGGVMVPVARSSRQKGIALAMASRLGAGPARFHAGTRPGWVDTVYLGAFRAEDGRALGGYALQATNEDAEFAYRMGRRGGVWFDPAIRSAYEPRGTLRSVAVQFYRYGRGRAETVRNHPSSLGARQLAPPVLVLGLLSPWRRWVAGAYLTLVMARASFGPREDPRAAAEFAACLPTMHLAWGTGFFAGLLRPSASARPTPNAPPRGATTVRLRSPGRRSGCSS
jgi:glycosyltransferase involved in cell wall biosynthesis